MRVRLSLLPWLVVAGVFGACAPSAPTPSVSAIPSPSYVCTPSVAGGPATPFACDRERYDEQQRQAALEAEAIAVYKRYWAEYMRLEYAGGADQPTPELFATTADPRLTDIMALLRYHKEHQQRAQGVLKPPVVRVDRAPIEGAEVALLACQDGTNLELVDSSGQVVDTGIVLEERLGLRRFEGQLKVFKSVDTGGTRCDVS